MPSILRHSNSETTEGSLLITCSNILRDKCINIGLKPIIVAILELFKVAVQDPLSSDDFLYCWTHLCNPLLKELKCSNHHCLLGLHMHLQLSRLFLHLQGELQSKVYKHVRTSNVRHAICYYFCFFIHLSTSTMHLVVPNIVYSHHNQWIQHISKISKINLIISWFHTLSSDLIFKSLKSRDNYKMLNWFLKSGKWFQNMLDPTALLKVHT